MARQTINIGSAPNDGTGDVLRNAYDKCNDNFLELYEDGGANILVNNPVTLTETSLDVALADLNTGGGSGGITSVTGPTVNNTDPDNPIVNVPSLQQVTDVGAVTTLPIIVQNTAGDIYTNVSNLGVTVGDADGFLAGLESKRLLLQTGRNNSLKGSEGEGDITLNFPQKVGTFDIATQSEIKSVNFTAEKATNYSTIENLIVTDPISGVTGDYYTVFVSSGVVTIEGVDYAQGNLIYRYLKGGLWISELINSDADLSAYVPYTGATTNLDLGEFDAKVGQLEFDQTPTGTFGVGKVRWNDSDGTIEVMLKGGNVTLQVGQEQLLRVVNKTGVNLLESQYKCVYISGAQGNRLKVDLALSNNTVNSNKTIGLVTENINNNLEGFITTSGLVRGVNTTGTLQSETWVEGDILYLSATITGGITNVLPVSPNHKVLIGYVVNVHATQGAIFVKVDTGLSLQELHNVNIVGTTANKVLGSLTEGLWENKTISQILGYTPQTQVALTTVGTSGASTFNPSTGALNIPNYAGGGGAGVVGTLNVNTTAVGNIGIGEDDLITYSVGAGTLANNNDYITFEGSGSFGGSINSKRLRIKFGSTTIFDSGMLAVTSAAEWVIEGTLIRTSATTFKADVRLNSSFASLAAYADYSTGTETFANALTLKYTGEATADNDIIQEFGIVKLNSQTTDALLSYATVAQLATKQNLLGYTPYKFIQNSDTALSGAVIGLTETIVATATINANTFNTADIMNMMYKCVKPATTANVTMRVRINTTNSLVGAAVIATYTLGAASQFALITRSHSLIGGNLLGFSFGTSAVTDTVASGSGNSSTPLNPVNLFYVFFTVQLGNVADSVTASLTNLCN